ncbi:MAG: Rab family GTPase [Pseudomonadota bacterium]
MMIRKVMMMGEMGVGKTSIVNQLVFKQFSADYNASIGTDVYQYECRPTPESDPVLLNVWDTDGSYGEAIFKSVYIRGAHGAIIVGDVTRQRTLETMSKLADTFERELPGRHFTCVLNKCDLLGPDDEIALPQSMVERRLPHVRTSALSGENVEAVFRTAAQTMVRRGF